RKSAHMRWYVGPTLFRHLDNVEVGEDRDERPFRMAVQWVNRPDGNFRGFCGTIASGRVRPGDILRVLPAARESRVTRIVTHDGDLDEAGAGQSVTLTFADEIDISRGDVLCGTEAPPAVTDQVEATLVWMAEEPLLAGRPYWLKVGSKQVIATVAGINYAVNVDTLDRQVAEKFALNEIGVCKLKLDRSIPVDTYGESR